jgi:hypothetical protein
MRVVNCCCERRSPQGSPSRRADNRRGILHDRQGHPVTHREGEAVANDQRQRVPRGGFLGLERSSVPE